MQIDSNATFVQTTQRGRVGIIMLQRPPINAMSAAFCGAIHMQLTQMLQSDAVDAVVLASGLAHFSSGTDISDLIKPRRGATSGLVGLCDLVSKAPKPVVAAISGICLGAGLELALAATARIASAGAQFGFPEIKMGLMTAAGSTLRLPRLIGPQAALDLLLDGPMLDSQAALEIRLIDQLATANLIEQACEFAQKIAQNPNILIRRDPAKDGLALQTAVTAARAKYAGRHLAAFDKIMSSVAAGQIFLPEQALALEQSSYEDLLFSSDVQGMCYGLIANQRLRSKMAKAAPAPGQQRLAQINILGGGALVVRLAVRALLAGIEVRLSIPDQNQLMQSMLRISGALDAQVSEGKLDKQGRTQARARLSTFTNVSEVDQTAVFLGSGAAYDGAIVLTKDRQAVPAGGAILMMPDQGLMQYHVGPKAPPIVPICLANLFAVLGIGHQHLAPGGKVESAIQDVLARSIGVLQNKGHSRDVVIAALASAGVGVDASHNLPAAPRGSHDILALIQLAMINRGAKMLRLGDIDRASDYDAIAVQARLFPRWLGGPLYLADRRGPMIVRAELRKLAADAPDILTPDAILDDLIASGRRFADLG